MKEKKPTKKAVKSSRNRHGNAGTKTRTGTRGRNQTKTLTITTAFDDVFRTMAQKMPFLFVALINWVFKTNYTEKDIESPLRNEFMEKGGKRITDSIFRLGRHLYHIECQSTDDGTMVIRMFEYDLAIAIEEARNTGSPYEIRFPNSCVLYVRSNDNIPDTMEMKVIMPDGQEIKYSTKVIKVSDYSLDEIFEKKLLCMLPYYLLRYEKELGSIEASKEKTKKLLEECEDISKRLSVELKGADKSTVYADLIDLINKVSEHILRNNKKLKRKVGDVMGGKVLELASERLIREGKKQGRREGREAGMKAGIAKGEARGEARGVARGTVMGAIETFRDMNVPEEEIASRIKAKYSLTDKEVDKYMGVLA